MPLPVAIVENAKDVTDWIVVGAAVVQAIGSVAAIIAAIWITRHDRQEAERTAAAAKISSLAVIISRAEQTLRVPFERIKQEGAAAYPHVFSRTTFGDNLRALERCRRILAQVPTHELGDWELASAVIDMQEALDVGESALKQVAENSEAALLYPEITTIDLAPLKGPVNLAAEATARVHQAAHRRSSSKEARRQRITPNLVT